MFDDIYKSDDDHQRLSMKIKKDVFYEMTVYTSAYGTNIPYIICMIMMVLMALIALLFLLVVGTGNILMFIFAGIAGFMCYVFYFLAQRTKIEYDYTFTNGTLDIAKIINDKQRKKLASIEMSELIEMQPITSDAFQAHFENKDIRKINMFINKGPHLYYMLLVRDEKKVAIVFEPDQKMVECMKQFNPDIVA